jgi:hypothetical protein
LPQLIALRKKKNKTRETKQENARSDQRNLKAVMQAVEEISSAVAPVMRRKTTPSIPFLFIF